MSLSLKYQLTRGDYLALAKITCRNIYAATSRKVQAKNLFWLVILFAAAFSAYLSDIIILLIIFVGAAAGLIYDMFAFKGRFWVGVENSTIVPKEPIVLKVSEVGLEEDSDGIKSFAPWPTVTSYVETSDHLFIALAERQWAIIPLKTLIEGDECLFALKELLSQHGINAEPSHAGNRSGPSRLLLSLRSLAGAAPSLRDT